MMKTVINNNLIHSWSGVTDSHFLQIHDKVQKKWQNWSMKMFDVWFGGIGQSKALEPGREASSPL